ncbi:c-type cytochrome [Neobacillus niacini]
MANGEELYKKSCLACHGANGEGTGAWFFYFLFIHFSALEYKNPSKAYSTTTTAAVQIRSCITPSAYKTGPSPNKVTSKRRMIKKAWTRNFIKSPPKVLLIL